MTGTIKITPEELRAAADFLQQKLGDMSNDANEMKSRIDDISDNWEGAAQSAFMTGFNVDMWPILNQKLPELIEGIQMQLKETANALEATDNELARMLSGQA